MALSALIFSPNQQALTHPSGRSYNPTSLGICTIPIADAMTWMSGGGEAVPGPTGPPASTIFPGQLLKSTVIGKPVLLGFTGATTDRWTANSPTLGFEVPPLGTPMYDTTVAGWIFYVGRGLGSTDFVDRTGAFV